MFTSDKHGKGNFQNLIPLPLGWRSSFTPKTLAYGKHIVICYVFWTIICLCFCGVLIYVEMLLSNRKKEFELQEMTKQGKELTKKKNETMKADGQREEE